MTQTDFFFLSSQIILVHALVRKQCRARVLAALGRALGVGPNGPVPPHPSDHAKSERTRSVLVLAAVGALQLRRSRRDSDASKSLEASVNELIDTIFGCYPSSKSAGVVPKGRSGANHLAQKHSAPPCSCT